MSNCFISCIGPEFHSYKEQNNHDNKKNWMSVNNSITVRNLFIYVIDFLIHGINSITYIDKINI